MALITLTDIQKTFIMGEEKIHALDNVNLKIHQGEFTSIVGTSGSGKSTLMNIIGLLDLPDHGVYELDGINVSHMKDDELSEIRNSKIGFVFQSFHLLPRSNALRNVEMPLMYSPIADKGEEYVRHLAMESLTKVGLASRYHHKPNELSGGQRQRVAIARALVNSPKLLLADEPTGALDSRTSVEILDLFHELNSNGVTIVLVTHDPKVADRCNRIVRMSDGKIIEDITKKPTPGLIS